MKKTIRGKMGDDGKIVWTLNKYSKTPNTHHFHGCRWIGLKTAKTVRLATTADGRKTYSGDV